MVHLTPHWLGEQTMNEYSTRMGISTLNTYRSGLLFFHIFCDSQSITEEHQAPVSYTLLSTFIAALAGTYSSSTITNYIAGLHTWHIIHQLKWEVNEDE
jgi:hypothetical protein